MPRFFIDIHVDSLSEWDDDGQLLKGADEAVELARDLALGALLNSQIVGAKQHASAAIRDEAGTPIATVTVGAPGEPQIVWVNRTGFPGGSNP